MFGAQGLESCLAFLPACCFLFGLVLLWLRLLNTGFKLGFVFSYLLARVSFSWFVSLFACLLSCLCCFPGGAPGLCGAPPPGPLGRLGRRPGRGGGGECLAGRGLSTQKAERDIAGHVPAPKGCQLEAKMAHTRALQVQMDHPWRVVVAEGWAFFQSKRPQPNELTCPKLAGPGSGIAGTAPGLPPHPAMRASRLEIRAGESRGSRPKTEFFVTGASLTFCLCRDSLVALLQSLRTPPKGKKGARNAVCYNLRKRYLGDPSLGEAFGLFPLGCFLQSKSTPN